MIVALRVAASWSANGVTSLESNMKYVEFCAGGGGMRAGLDAAGWECALALDNDPDAVAVHRLAHGDAHQADVTSMNPSEIPEVDAWVAGFPCQPFSSSGNRGGFSHRSGNVFENLVQLVSGRLPSLLVFENVSGLLINKDGHTMAEIIARISELGYSVSWCLIDLRWFGVAQTRPRLFIIGTLPGVLNVPFVGSGENGCQLNAFGDFLQDRGMTWKERERGVLSETRLMLKPAIGKAKRIGSAIFGPLGSASKDQFFSYELRDKPAGLSGADLGSLVAPNFRHRDHLRSGRYYARGGPTHLCLRDEPISHCVGTSLGGAPLFAVPLRFVRRTKDRAAFLEHSNWHREQDGMLVMRLRPNRAVLLFGPHTDALHRAVMEWSAGDTRKYKVVGNMVAPVCAKAVAETINEQLSHRAGSLRSKPVVSGKQI